MIEVLHCINYMSGKHAPFDSQIGTFFQNFNSQCDSRYGLARFMTQYDTFTHATASILMYYVT